MHPNLSIIMPFCNEYPMVAFTVQSVLNEISSLGNNAELIVIDNFCEEVKKQKVGEEFCPCCMSTFQKFRVKDRGGDFLQKQAKHLPQLKYLQYTEKLSHWNAKNLGVKIATGDTLLFLDSHVVPSIGSIKEIFNYYTIYYKELNGTLHLPLAYLLDSLSNTLIYKLDINPDKGYYHYKFSKYRQEDKPYEVACMSTCGMMISRELFDLLGGWPDLHIYGGGENFLNFCLAVLGKKKWIMPTGPLYHYADTRGYFYNYDSFVKNRMIATYLFAGEDSAHKFAKNCHGNPAILERLFIEAVKENTERRKDILGKQKMSIEEWLVIMKEKKLWDGTFSKKEFVD